MIISDTPLDRQFANFMRRFDPGMEVAVEWAAYLVSHAVGEGHVCLELRHWAGREIEPGRRLPTEKVWTEMLLASAVVGGPHEFKPMMIEGGRLYLARYWHYESQLAQGLLARAGQICEDIDLAKLTADLNRLFAHNADLKPDWQKTAAAVALLRRFCVISGGPGTGKTSTVVRILAALQSQANGTLRIALAAPTGKAAARMQDAIRMQKRQLNMPDEIIQTIPETASTLHRLLGSKPDSVNFRHNRENPLMADVVVVDEASMIDLALLAKLVDALPGQSRLILLGDKDQLAAVEAGSVFGDICLGQGYSRSFCERLSQVSGVNLQDSGDSIPELSNCIALLHHSHRFGRNSGIGELARRINAAGEALPVIDLLKNGNFHDIAWRSQFGEADVLERMGQGYQPFFTKVSEGASGQDVLSAFNQFRILVAHHQGTTGAFSVNQAFETLLRERQRIPRHERWFPGRAVMVTRNDYGMKLFNGDIGICLRVDGELRVCFEDADSQLRTIAPARLPDYVLSFAMTVHKSQGSEFDQAVFLLPEAVSPVLNRPLVYTAITRAKHRVEIWGGQDVLTGAVSQFPERSSGLRGRLWGQFS